MQEMVGGRFGFIQSGQHHCFLPNGCNAFPPTALTFGESLGKMAHEWFPWYPALYKADTMHLTAEQDGIYRRLIDHYMETRQPLPDSDHALARIAGVDPTCWMHASSIVRAFFKQSKDGFLRHPFCENQLEKQDKLSNSRSLIAKKAAEKRWNNQGDTCIEHASSMPEAKQMDATRQDKTRHKEKDKSFSYSAEFEDFWSGWKPYDMDKGPKLKAAQAYKKARKQVDHATLISARDAHIEFCHQRRQKTPHAVTWLNQSRWTDEVSTPAEPWGPWMR